MVHAYEPRASPSHMPLRWQVLAAFVALGMLLTVSLMHMQKAHDALSVKHGQFQMLYNKWGTNDNNDHWGGVGR